MKRFILRFLFLFVTAILILFSVLVFFQKHNMAKSQKQETDLMLENMSSHFSMYLENYLYKRQTYLQNDFAEGFKLKGVTKISKADSLQEPFFNVNEDNQIMGNYYVEKDDNVYLITKNENLEESIFIPAPVAVEIYKTGEPDNIITELNITPARRTDLYKDLNFGDISLRFTFLEQNKPSAPSFIVPQILIIGLSILLLFFIIKYINDVFVNPLILITENLQKIQNGTFDVKFETKSENNTIKNTFRTLNDMVSGLKEREALRDNFIQNLTHDLRAPIIAQERAIAILEQEFSGHELLQGMKENSETYLKMINLIIEANSHDNMSAKIEKTELNISELADTVIKALKPMADEKKIKIIKDIVPDNIVLYADFISTNRIIMNLVANAIENIENDKTVKITVRKNPVNTILTVEDNGCGIAEDEMEHIFDKYASKNKSGKKAVSGLGLYITKELVKKNGGKISIQSKKELYTKFIIELPNKD